LDIKANMQHNVVHFDRLSSNKMAEVVCKFRYYLTCSLLEGDPKGVLEGIGFGLVPVVSTTVAIIIGIQHWKNGFVFDSEEELLGLIPVLDSLSDFEFNSIISNSQKLLDDRSLDKISCQYIDLLKEFKC